MGSGTLNGVLGGALSGGATAGPWGALAGGVLGGIDGMGQDSAADKQAKALKKALAILRQTLAEQSTAGGLALQEQRRGLDDIQSGFQRGLQSLTSAGRSDEVLARDNAAQTLGADTQDLISRGQYNPEHTAYSRAGVSAGLSRVLHGIYSDVAQRRANLLTQGGMAMAGQRSNIAGQIGQNFSQRAGIAGNIGQLGIDSAPAMPQNYGTDIGWLVESLKSLNSSGTGSGGYQSGYARSWH